MKSLSQSILLLLTVFVMSAVLFLRPPGANVDTSIISERPCRIPCWYGLIPGHTRIDEHVQNIIENIDFIRAADGSHETTNGTETIFGWHYIPKPDNKIIFRNDVLYRITIDPNLYFTLEDILDLYGEPAGFTVHYERAPHENEAILFIEFYFPDVGMIVRFQAYRGIPSVIYRLDPEMPGRTFELYEPASTLENFVAPIYDLPPEHGEVITNLFLIRGWPGYYARIVEPYHGYELQPPPLPTILPPLPT